MVTDDWEQPCSEQEREEIKSKDKAQDRAIAAAATMERSKDGFYENAQVNIGPAPRFVESIDVPTSTVSIKEHSGPEKSQRS